MTVESRQRIVQVIGKRYGIPVRPDTVRFLEEKLTEFDVDEPGEIEESVVNILDVILRQDSDADINDVKALQAAVDKFISQQHLLGAIDGSVAKSGSSAGAALAAASAHSQRTQEHLHVISAFDVPHFHFDRQHHLFHAITDVRYSLVDTAERKVDVFRYRFDLIKQRLMRNDSFKPPAFMNASSTTGSATDYLKITPIKNLLGCQGQTFLLLGMLSQRRQGKFFLEDLDAEVELDLSDADIGKGLFTETCMVLVTGVYMESGEFKVQEMGLPPPENREKSRTANKLVDFFGGPTTEISLESQSIESNEDNMFVVLSDVWLDQPRVLEKLRTLFAGYAAAGITPVAFILMGNFLSEPFAYNGAMSQKYKDAFNELTDLILQFPVIARLSHFIIVPGPNDPAGGKILPKPGIHKIFTERLRAKLGRCTIASNPCRIKFCSQEFVVFREDLAAKMLRNALVKPVLDDQTSLFRHLVCTLINQSHLCPLPLAVSPTYWAHDNALHLYPNPHVIMLGDHSDPVETTFSNTLCFNPGPFAVTKYQFMVYFPSTRTVDFSQVE